MSELLTTLKDMLAGGKVRWPSKKDPVGMAQRGEAGERRMSGPSSGQRPKRPAPAKPPSTTHSHKQKEKEQALVISNPAVASKGEVEGAMIAEEVSPPQGASTSTEKDEKGRASKSHKAGFKRDLSASTELLLELSLIHI